MRFALNHIAAPNLSLPDFFAAARDLGVTEVEIQECLLQVATYVGMPAGMEAFRAADKAVQEWKSTHAAGATANQK